MRVPLRRPSTTRSTSLDNHNHPIGDCSNNEFELFCRPPADRCLDRLAAVAR